MDSVNLHFNCLIKVHDDIETASWAEIIDKDSGVLLCTTPVFPSSKEAMDYARDWALSWYSNLAGVRHA